MALSSYERRIVTEIARTLFPHDALLPVSGEDARVLERVEAYLMDVPALQRTELRALLVAFDVGFSATMLRPFTRFVDAKAEQRETYINKCENMRGALRMAFDGLRFIFLLAYVESPRVSQFLNIEQGWMARQGSLEPGFNAEPLGNPPRSAAPGASGPPATGPLNCGSLDSPASN